MPRVNIISIKNFEQIPIRLLERCALMANWWSLKIISGDDAGREFRLNTDRTVIGRVKGDILLEGDDEASSVHAEISYDERRHVMVLHDLRSRNGVKVNGEKVEKRVLTAGDRIKIGFTEMVLEPPADEATRVNADADATRVSEVDREAATKVMNEVREPTVSMVLRAEKKISGKEPTAEEVKKVKFTKETSSSVKLDSQGGQSARRPRPVESEPEAPRDFSSFSGTFFGVLLHPLAFFDWLGQDDTVQSAWRFGAFNWIASGIISGILSYFFIFVWRVTPPGVDFGTSPLAIAIGTVVGLAALPVVAAVYHGICLALGGHAPFSRALQILCYLSAVHFVFEIAGVFPHIGPFLRIIGAAYSIFVLSVAAVRLYHVPLRSAYAACSAVMCATVGLMFLSQVNARKLATQLTQQLEQQQQTTTQNVVVVQPEPSNQRDPAADSEAAAAPEQESQEPASSDPEPPVSN